MDFDIAKNLLHYDYVTGDLTWKARCRELFKTDRSFNSWNSKHAEKKAGTIVAVNGKNYLHVTINGKAYKAHRIAFLLHYGRFPEMEIDHINGNGLDNRIINLRDCSNKINKKNKKLYKSSLTKISGVRRISGCKWISVISSNGKELRIGTFTDFFEACCKRKSHEILFGYHQNHGH